MDEFITNMKRTLLLASLISIFLMGTVSCKKCTVAEEDAVSGLIIPNSVVYAKSGYLTEKTSYNVFNGSQFADDFEVSFDGGLTRVSVDYSAYTILANPMSINCKASFMKSVTQDDINNIVRYEVNATTCKSCEQERFVENYVLVSKIPSNYTVLFPQDIQAN